MTHAAATAPHDTTAALLRRLEGLPLSERRPIADEAIRRRRGQLALMRELMVEKYGQAPTLERLAARDELLAELQIIAAA